MCTVQSKKKTSISSSLSWALCAVLTLSGCALHGRSITMDFLLWMFFSLFFTRHCWKPNVPSLLKDKIKLKSQVVLVVRCVLFVFVSFTCQSACRNAPRTLGVLGGACASLIVPPWSDLVILVWWKNLTKRNVKKWFSCNSSQVLKIGNAIIDKMSSHNTNVLTLLYKANMSPHTQAVPGGFMNCCHGDGLRLKTLHLVQRGHQRCFRHF